MKICMNGKSTTRMYFQVGLTRKEESNLSEKKYLSLLHMDQLDMNQSEKNAIFEKQYDGDSIVDVSRDVTEAFDVRFNPTVESIPTVTIIWEPCSGEINEK